MSSEKKQDAKYGTVRCIYVVAVEWFPQCLYNHVRIERQRVLHVS
jgi:hypothetical protein